MGTQKIEKERRNGLHLHPENIEKMFEDLTKSDVFKHCAASSGCNPENVKNVLNQFLNPESCKTEEKTWTEKIDLTKIPTKSEELHIKMENETNTISISGKSEVTKNSENGFQVFSTHVWSKQIKAPESIDPKTITAKMVKNILTISAEYKKHEINIEHIAQEKLD